MMDGHAIDRPRAEGELSHTVSLLEAALDAAADGILVVDRNRRIVRFNAKFAQIWRLPASFTAERAERLELAHVRDQLQDPRTFIARIEQIYRHPQAVSFDVLRFKDGRVYERHSQPQRLGQEIVGRVWSFRDVTERTRAEAETRLLQTLPSALAEAEDRDTMLQIVLSRVCASTGWALGQAWLPDASGAALECGPCWASAAEAMGPFRVSSLATRFPPRKGLPGRVWASHAPEWIRDLTADERFVRASSAREVGLRSAIGFPIVVRGEVLGVIEFLVRQPPEVDERRVELVEAVTALLGAALERKRAAAELRESEARYRTLVEHAPEAILVIDPARGTFRSANENAVHLFGYPRERLLTLGPADLSPPTQPDGAVSTEAVQERFQRVLEGGVAVFEWVHRSATGREFPCEVRLVRLPGTGPPLVRGSVTDITERKRNEALLAGQRRVLELIATGASLADTLTCLVRFIESQSQDMIGSVLLLDEDGKHVRHGAAPGLPEAYNRAIEGAPIGPSAGSCGTAAYRREPVIVTDIRTDPLWADYRALAAAHGLRACWSTPIFSYKGAVLGTFAMYYREPRAPTPGDFRVIEIATHLAGVTIERRYAEEALRRDAAEIEDLYENAPCGYHSTDHEGRIVRMNATELAWLGYTREEVVGKKRFRDLLTEEGWAELSARLPRLLATVPLRDVELDLVRKDGSLLPVLLGATGVRATDGTLVLGRAVVIDNAQRKRDAEALRASERTYRALYTSTPVMMHSIDREGRLLSVSDDWLATLGYEREEVIGRKSVDFLTPASARYAAEVVLPAFLASGQSKDVPYEFVKKNGEILDVLLSATAERDATGQVVCSLAVLIDVTERKRVEAELQRYREHLEDLVAARTRNLEALNHELEAFCYSVSHDLRAPLRSIDGFSQILLEDYGATLDARGREHLLRIRAADQRMAQLIDDLLNLSRVGRAELHRQPVDLSALARQVAELVRHTAPARDVEWVIEEGVHADGDPRLLRVVLENLFANAWKFTSKHPHARIEFGQAVQDGHTVYFVRDDGAGFDMKYVDKLFGAFERLHGAEEFEGTGIGLATVQRIVQRHGGRVWAEGAVEKGATFSFTL